MLLCEGVEDARMTSVIERERREREVV